MTENDLHSLALKAGAAYWKETMAEKPTYLMSIDELGKFVELARPNPITDEIIGELWHKAGGHMHRFARLLEEFLGAVNAG